jgi:hypothetical protein
MVVIPFQVAIWISLDNDAPSVRSHYRTLNPTTGISAPVPCIGTQTLTVTNPDHSVRPDGAEHQWRKDPPR